MASILIVEDEPAIAESMSFTLRRDGFNVQTAACLSDATNKLANTDLVLLDLMLPDGSGFDLIVDIRRTAKRPAIIVLTSRDEEPDRIAALESGADDYVTKPFSPREVVARVRAVLRRTQPSYGTQEPTSLPTTHTLNAHSPGQLTPHSEASTTSGATPPVRVDHATRRATVLGAPLELTRVEFDMLACMVEDAGRVFTRAQLIDRVWGDGFAITDRTVDAHIKGLRRKITEVCENMNVLETVRGVGYRLSLDYPRQDDTP